MGISFRSPHRYASIHGTAVLRQTSALPSYTRQRLPERSSFLPVQTWRKDQGGVKEVHSRFFVSVLQKETPMLLQYANDSFKALNCYAETCLTFY
jgi:hypothetical protein